MNVNVIHVGKYNTVCGAFDLSPSNCIIVEDFHNLIKLLHTQWICNYNNNFKNEMTLKSKATKHE